MRENRVYIKKIRKKVLTIGTDEVIISLVTVQKLHISAVSKRMR